MSIARHATNTDQIDPLASRENVREDSIYRVITWRIVPLLIACYTIAYLDRVNVGYAKLQMAQELKFSDTVYGLGAGVFFIGYVLAEVPSNLILYRVGARKWIARILITWGLMSAAMIFTSSPASFYVLRFLLGVAEAGFFPGIIFYLMNWYPAHRRGRVLSFFYLAAPLSGMIGGPVSGLILKGMSDVPPFSDWQWMFLIEAIPAVILGIIVVYFLSDDIKTAPWLSASDKKYLLDHVDLSGGKSHAGLKEIFTSRRVWHLAAILFTIVMALYGVFVWMPTLVNESGIKDPLAVGLLSAIPYAAAIPMMLLIGAWSDRMQDRRWLLVGLCLLGMISFLLSIRWQHETVWLLLAMTIATMAVMSSLPVFWTMPTAALQGRSAAAGIALINSLGVTAGFVAPYMVGYLRDLTGSTNAALYILAVLWFIGAILTVLIPKHFVARKL